LRREERRLTKPWCLSGGTENPRLAVSATTGLTGMTWCAFGGLTGWTRTLLTVSMSPKGESGVRKVRRSRPPSHIPAFLEEEEEE